MMTNARNEDKQAKQWLAGPSYLQHDHTANVYADRPGGDCGVIVILGHDVVHGKDRVPHQLQ